LILLIIVLFIAHNICRLVGHKYERSMRFCSGVTIRCMGGVNVLPVISHAWW